MSVRLGVGRISTIEVFRVENAALNMAGSFGGNYTFHNRGYIHLPDGTIIPAPIKSHVSLKHGLRAFFWDDYVSKLGRRRISVLGRDYQALVLDNADGRYFEGSVDRPELLGQGILYYDKNGSKKFAIFNSTSNAFMNGNKHINPSAVRVYPVEPVDENYDGALLGKIPEVEPEIIPIDQLIVDVADFDIYGALVAIKKGSKGKGKKSKGKKESSDNGGKGGQIARSSNYMTSMAAPVSEGFVVSDIMQTRYDVEGFSQHMIYHTEYVTGDFVFSREIHLGGIMNPIITGRITEPAWEEDPETVIQEYKNRCDVIFDTLVLFPSPEYLLVKNSNRGFFGKLFGLIIYSETGINHVGVSAGRLEDSIETTFESISNALSRRPNERVSIVVYASSLGLGVPYIENAIERIHKWSKDLNEKFGDRVDIAIVPLKDFSEALENTIISHWRSTFEE